jgi:hypothetical protein
MIALSGLQCEFAASITLPAASRSANTITCTTPPMLTSAGRELSVRVRENDVFIAGVVTFQYTSPDIEMVFYGPSWGPLFGGTSIIVAFHRSLSQEHFCFFDSVRVPLISLGQNARQTMQKYQCASPSSDRPKSSEVRLSLNGADTVSRPIRFEYEIILQVHSLFPTQGSCEGGERVIVYGSGFTRRASEREFIWCMFNHIRVRAIYISNDAISCTSPSYQQGAVALEVTNNNQQFSTNGIVFAFMLQGLVRVHPAGGPIRGGTLIMITARTVMSISSFNCNFEDGITSASFQSHGRVVCRTPLRNIAGSVRVSLHAAGTGDREMMQSTAFFTFHDEVSLIMALPSFGPAVGGTQLALKLAEPLHASLVWCSFRMLVGQGGSLPIPSPARFLSASIIICVSPATNNRGVAAISISQNAQDQSVSVVTFEYVNPIHVLAITPSQGPVHGGTHISVVGDHVDGRWSSLALATCKFEQLLGRLVIVAASLLGDNEALCTTTSAHLLGASSIELSLNGVDYTTDGRSFEFVSMVVSLNPTAGPILGDRSYFLF